MTTFGEVSFDDLTFGEMPFSGMKFGEVAFGNLTFGEPTGHRLNGKGQTTIALRPCMAIGQLVATAPLFGKGDCHPLCPPNSSTDCWTDYKVE